MSEIKTKSNPVLSTLEKRLSTPISRRTFLKASAVAGASTLFSPYVFAQSKPIELTYWHGWTGDWTNMVQFVVDMFHEKQDRIRIKPEVVAWDQLLVKLSAAIAAGNPPDIVTLFGSAAIPTLASQGAIIPLEDISGVDLAAAQAWFDPSVYQLGQYENKTYGLSYWAGAYSLLYNKQHFSDAGLSVTDEPWDIAQLDAYAQALTLKEGNTLSRMGYLPNTEPNQFWMYGTIFGGDFYDDTTKQITANDPNIVRALEWFQSYPERYGANEVAAFLSGLANERAQNLDPFIAQKFSMMAQGPWKLGDLKNYGNDLDFGVVIPPIETASSPKGNWTWGDMQIIPKGTKDAAAAAEFVQFTGGVNDPEGYVKRVTWGNRPINVPVSKRVLEEPAFQDLVAGFPGFSTFIDSLLNAERVGSPPVMPATAFYTDRLTNTVESVMLLKSEPQAALDKLTVDVQKQLDRSS